MSTFPVVAPPPDGLRLAFGVARRRRTGKAAVGATAGLVSALLLVVSLGGSGNRTLLQEPLPPASGGGGSLPVIELTPEAGAASPPAAGRDVVALTPARGAPVRPRPVLARGIRTPSPDRVAAVRRPSPKVSAPMYRDSMLGYGNNDLTCPARKRQQGSRGLCTEVSSSSSAGGRITLRANICNVDTSDATMSYPTGRELDVAIVLGGEEVWRWSKDRRFATTPHAVPLPVGECLMWTTEWGQVDQSGRPVAKGVYRIVADFDADELTESDRHSTASVTVS
jgi:hypothetical protein